MSEESDQPDGRKVFDYAARTERRTSVVAKISNPIQAQFTANLLERAGIMCVVLNSNSSNMGIAVGYVPCELLVRPEDCERAMEILNDLAAGRISLAAIDETDEDGPDEEDAGGDGDMDAPEPRCPKCSSWQVRRYVSLWEDFLRFLRLVPRPPEGANEFECLRCSHRWVELVNVRPRK